METSTTDSPAVSQKVSIPDNLIQNPSKKQMIKFLIPSAIGVFLFLCPIWVDGNMNIPLGVISDWVANFISPFSAILITVVVIISAVMALIATFMKPAFIMNNKMLRGLFTPTPIYLGIRVIGAVLTVLIFFKAGSEVLWSGDTGGTMMSLMGTLIAWFFAASFLIPLLMDYGIMDYTGTLIRSVLKPLFTLPGRSALDLLASWIGNCNVGVALTSKQYEEGYYTAREAIIIATCFSAVSLPFCLVIAAMMDLDQYFVPFYLILTATGVICTVIMTRVWPLRGKFRDEYYEPVGKQINEVVPTGVTKTRWALMQAVTKADKGPNAGQVLYKGFDTFMGIVFSLVPVTMCVGTVALIIATYTPFFDWIGLPFGYYMQLLGLEQGLQAGAGAIVGFVDMFIPAILCAGLEDIETRFVVGVLSLVQIIYMTEVGSLMLISKMPVKFFDLLIIFLEKTILAIPIIILLTKIFMPF